MDTVKIDRKVLFALASNTRIKMLKKLRKRRMTLTELSKELNISKTAVKEHLDKLVEAGLVERTDEGRKWIYYGLTEKGKNVLNPKNKKLILLLSIASFAGGLIELYWSVSSSNRYKPPAPVPVPTPTKVPETTPNPAPVSMPAARELSHAAGIHLLIGHGFNSDWITTFAVLYTIIPMQSHRK